METHVQAYQAIRALKTKLTRIRKLSYRPGYGSYVLGFSLQEVNLPFSNAEELAAVGEELLAQVPGDQYPNLARVSTELLASGFDYRNEFEFGLDLILDGIERTLQGA